MFALFVVFTACAFGSSIAAFSVATKADTQSGATPTEGDLIARANKAQQGFVMGTAAGKVLFMQAWRCLCMPWTGGPGADQRIGPDLS